LFVNDKYHESLAISVLISFFKKISLKEYCLFYKIVFIVGKYSFGEEK